MTACPNLAALEAGTEADHAVSCRSCAIVVELLAERRRGLDADECASFELLIAAREQGAIGKAGGALLDEHLRTCADCMLVANTLAPSEHEGATTTLPAVSTSAYAIGREVARGGMGRILSAHDLRVGRPVAVKELLGKSPALAARFEREARVTARLQHPGIVPIYEIGTWPDGTPFYSMRMVEGRTLREALGAETTLDGRLALLPTLLTAAEAVAFAHGQRVIHRDLTPSNILVGAHGDTVVIDWGLAKDLSEPVQERTIDPYRDAPVADGNLTNVGAVIGTAAYMPPEQAMGTLVDERGDVYALGAILYHLLAGAPPYHGASGDQLVIEVQSGPPASIGDVAPGAPRDLVSIATKAMARTPSDRYASAPELAAELRRFQTGRLVEAHHYSRRELVRRWIRRRRAVVTVAVIATVVLGAGGALAVRDIVAQRDRAETGEHVAVIARDTADAQQKASHALARTLTAEQGRQELLAGHPMRALPFLSAAYSDGDTSPETRFMIATAMHLIDSRRFSLKGDDSPAKHLVFGDGRLVVVHDDLIEVWELAHGTRVATLRAPELHVTNAAISPDGLRVAAWSDTSPQIAVFDLPGGPPHVLGGHTQQVLAARFIGRGLVSIAMDGTWRRWDLATGTSRSFAIGPLRRGGGGPAGFGTPDFDNAGTRLLALRLDGTAEVWDIARGARIGSFHVDHAYGAALSGDGMRVLAWNNDTVVAWDVASGRQLGTTRGPGYHMMGCGFRPDGGEVFIAGDRGFIDIWTSDLGKRVSTLRVPTGMIAPAWLGHDRMLVGAAAGKSAIQLWDPDLETPIATLDSLPQFGASADGVQFAFARDHGDIEVADLGALGLVRRMFVPTAAGNAASLDGARVATFDAAGAVTLRDLDHDGRSLAEVALHTPVAVTGATTVALGDSGDLVVLDSANGHVMHRWPAGAKPTSLQLTLDGRAVLVVAATGVRLLDVATGAELAKITVGIRGARVSGDGRTVIVLDDHRHMIAWSVEAGRATATIDLGGEIIWSELLVISSDGHRAALPVTEPPGFGMRLYDTTSGTQLAAIGPAVFGSFAGDNLVAGAIDGTLHVVRATDGSELRRFPIETSLPLPQLAPDGARFAITSPDGTTEIRSAADGRALARFTMRPAVPNLDVEHRTFEYGISVGGITDSLVTVGNEATALAVWDIHVETRPPTDIAKLVADFVPWRLENGHLVPR
jgi:WD40 repeat protein